jgi:hypothetical protein
MFPLTPNDPVDYLLVGHLTRDLTPLGPRVGGTAAFAALTARSLGLRVGIVTSWAADLPLGPLRDIPIVNYETEKSTTFENIQTPQGRIQYLRQIAPTLEMYMIPEAWRSAPIVHLGPVAQEVNPSLVRSFPAALIGVTPQGWLRNWDREGKVSPAEWPESAFVLGRAGAAIMSVEDVGGDEERIEEMAASCHVLAVTDAHHGSRVYWNGDVRHFKAPTVKEVDPTGAGDVYAAVFLSRLYTTRDPWEAGRFATQLASISITRIGLNGIPTQEEIQENMVEVF